MLPSPPREEQTPSGKLSDGLARVFRSSMRSSRDSSTSSGRGTPPSTKKKPSLRFFAGDEPGGPSFPLSETLVDGTRSGRREEKEYEDHTVGTTIREGLLLKTGGAARGGRPALQKRDVLTNKRDVRTCVKKRAAGDACEEHEGETFLQRVGRWFGTTDSLDEFSSDDEQIIVGFFANERERSFAESSSAGGSSRHRPRRERPSSATRGGAATRRGHLSPSNKPDLAKTSSSLPAPYFVKRLKLAWQVDIKDFLDRCRCLRKLDDTFTSLCQNRLVRSCPQVVRAVSSLLSIPTSLECTIMLPFLMAYFANGYSPKVMLSCWLVVGECFVVQFLKRFFFRPRPWMDGRAIGLKENKSSSFPSRDHTAGTVLLYIWFVVFSSSVGVSVPFVVVSASCVLGVITVARVAIGAHYLSDCVAGFVVSFAGIGVGILLSKLDEEVCSEMYERRHFSQEVARSANKLLIVAGLFTALLLAAMGMHFRVWKKHSTVLGVLCPVLIYHYGADCWSERLRLPRVRVEAGAGGAPSLVGAEAGGQQSAPVGTRTIELTVANLALSMGLGSYPNSHGREQVF